MPLDACFVNAGNHALDSIVTLETQECTADLLQSAVIEQHSLPHGMKVCMHMLTVLYSKCSGVQSDMDIAR